MSATDVLLEIVRGFFGLLKEIASKWYVYVLLALLWGLVKADVLTEWIRATAGKLP